jgi:L-aminopeptidase/D-esterase-like protein
MRRVLMLVGPIVLAVGLAVPGSAAEPLPRPEAEPPVSSCSGMCPMIYEPVICELSDGVTRSFSNDCVARAYACDRELRIVGCVARQVTAPR